MRIPLSWLKDLLDINLSPTEIAETLTDGGIEVEKIEEQKDDLIFEISLTPNLGHCMSVLGIARELASLKNLPLKKRAVAVKETGDKIESKISVKIEDPQQCLRYTCRFISGVKVGPSPDWLAARLEASGVRSINNIVDVTNYVMLERGQPLHAFDYDKISGKKIRVTSKTETDVLVTLDDKTRTIPEGVLLIADETRPLAFAGVMGGKESSVTEGTHNVLIESCYFTPQAIRKSSKLLQLRTEGSQRWEKEVDFEGMLPALDQAALLMQELAGGQIAKGHIDEVARFKKREPITCRVDRANALLGLHLSLREIVSIFKRLEIAIVREEQNQLHVTPPSFRNDLKTEIDLIEEIARIYGYQNIPLTASRHVSSTTEHAPLFRFEREIRKQLTGSGLQECITCDLISPTLAELTAEASDPSSWVRVLDPGSVDQSVLRTSLLPGLLQTLRLNHAHQRKELALFEIGQIHFKKGSEFQELPMVGILYTGPAAPYHFDPKPREVDFFDLKGSVENLLLSVGIKEIAFEPSHLHNFHPGRQARIKIHDLYVGALGELHPGKMHALDIDARVYFAEINLLELYHLRKKELKVAELPLFPGSERDWTLTMKEEISIGSILRQILELRTPFLENIQLVDIYRGPQVGSGKKNVTLRFFYRDRAKTISLEAVEDAHSKITQTVAKKLDHLLH